MKKISIKNLKIELDNLSNNESKKTIILNNAEIYNDLILNYKADKQAHNAYIIIQLNGMIVKQITELEKNNTKQDVENDSFIQMINEIKNNKIVK